MVDHVCGVIFTATYFASESPVATDAADSFARRRQARIESKRVSQRRRRSDAEERVGRFRRCVRVRHRGDRPRFSARLLVEFARSGEREAVGGGLHLRLQAHAARAIEGQESEANENRQHHRHIRDHQSICVAPQRHSAAARDASGLCDLTKARATHLQSTAEADKASPVIVVVTCGMLSIANGRKKNLNGSFVLDEAALSETVIVGTGPRASSGVA